MMIYEPTEAEIFHYGGSKHSHLHNQDSSAILVAGVAPSVLAGGLRRGLGARLASMGGSGGGGGASAADYNTDGLILMFDAIENAGYGLHDESATTWVNLAKNLPNACNWDMTMTGAVWEDGKCKLSTGCYGEGGKWEGVDLLTHPLTIEIVAQFKNNSFVSAIGWTYYGGAQNRISVMANGANKLTFLNVRGLQINISTSLDYSATSIVNNFRENQYVFWPDVDVYKNSQFEQNIQASEYIRKADQTKYETTNRFRVNAYGSASDTIYGTGMMDVSSIRMYTRQLSAEEVAANYAVDAARFNLI